jgi:hypothetical protein
MQEHDELPCPIDAGLVIDDSYLGINNRSVLRVQYLPIFHCAATRLAAYPPIRTAPRAGGVERIVPVVFGFLYLVLLIGRLTG